MRHHIEKGLEWLHTEKELLKKTRSEIEQINSVCRETASKIEEYTEGKIEKEVVIQTIKNSVLLLSKLLTGLITSEPDLKFLESEGEEEVGDWLEHLEKENVKESVSDRYTSYCEFYMNLSNQGM